MTETDMNLDITHSPERQSFLSIPRDSLFPIQNLPYGVFSSDADPAPRIGTRIGDLVVDLAAIDEAGLFADCSFGGQGIFAQASLNALMALGRPAWREARAAISRLLWLEEASLRDNSELQARVLIPLASVTMQLPAQIGDYTDFYASREHATNVGTMFRGVENALMPNWLHLPVGYHGRASSIVVSGTDFHRPSGQTMADGADRPSFGPSRLLDFELEMGSFVGSGNALGHAVPISEAEDHVFGMVLLNDWSARDIQKWEYQPLGPFLAKNFCSSISPWVVTMEALEPFRVAGPEQRPAPLPYLENPAPQAFDIQLEVLLQSESMRQTHRLSEPFRISQTNFKLMYWSIAQQLAHHTATGCNLRPGDLLGSGTISGSSPDSRGSMLEIAWRGTLPVQLPTGETRSFLADGDTVIMRGRCEGPSYSIGFGEVRGTVLPARV
jgi:fumarylacetoacetase